MPLRKRRGIFICTELIMLKALASSSSGSTPRALANFYPRVCFETLGRSAFPKSTTLKELRANCPQLFQSCEHHLKCHLTRGWPKRNHGLKLANALGVFKTPRSRKTLLNHGKKIVPH